MTKTEQLNNIAKRRILVLDGAMGTLIQQHNLTEEEFRGDILKHHTADIKGNNDILNITQPGIISDIHREYLNAGADIIETNTFNANKISQADYNLEHLVYDINYNGARLAKKAAEEFSASTPDKPRFVAGSVGPTNQTASMSPDVNNPGYRAVDFSYLEQVYYAQAEALANGGVDIFLVETVFDTLNAKAALHAINRLKSSKGYDIPVMVSGTITDASGRTLSGQTPEALYISLKHADLFSIGLNCALGAKQLQPHLKSLSQIANCYISVHPNAGLPNELGEYNESAQEMAEQISGFATQQLINIAGGCCGTTPEHIEHIVDIISNKKPRIPVPHSNTTTLSGLEHIDITADRNFINIGERANVAGSARFARLIREHKFEQALDIVTDQVEGGAQVIDICMDDALIDAKEAMIMFLNLIASDPNISKLPLMIDSSDFEVIEAGLRCTQGKSVVNSISLKDGEERFVKEVKTVLQYGAAVVVMLFDERGQADSYNRKIEVADRAYRILSDIGFPVHDIIFDPNVLTVATGIKEHNCYAVDFIKTCRWIKENMPHAKISGGISNISFSFRGNNTIREAMHSVFLYHAIDAGLDMGIVNPAMLQVYSEIPENLIKLTEDVILNRRSDAVERLSAYAEQISDSISATDKRSDWRLTTVDKRLSFALLKGITQHIDDDIKEALEIFSTPIEIIDKPLMQAMNSVGNLFGKGQMFLPQVIKSARVMRKAVDILKPLIVKDSNEVKAFGAGKVLLATVKGDVHDIGKNIVGIVLSCNNYKVTDIGIMTPAEEIINIAVKEKVDIIGLSGLITPSLNEMVNVVQLLEQSGLDIPVIIGGAATSKLHTALKIAPEYSGIVAYTTDASTTVTVINSIINNKKGYSEQIKEEYQREVNRYNNRQQQKGYISLNAARNNRLIVDSSKIYKPNRTGVTTISNLDIDILIPYIDWRFFFGAWSIKGRYPDLLNDPVHGTEATRLYNDALDMLKDIKRHGWLKANGVTGIFPANSDGDNTIIYCSQNPDKVIATVSHLRNQQQKESGYYNLSLADFLIQKESGIKDYIGAFAVTAGINAYTKASEFEINGDNYSAIMLKVIADRLTEAFAEYLHHIVRTELWGYSNNNNLSANDMHKESYVGIRPAPGYPACPDHSQKGVIFDILKVSENTGIKLTESYAMNPGASVAGWIYANSNAKYFAVDKIDSDQLTDYAGRKNISTEEASSILHNIININRETNKQ